MKNEKLYDSDWAKKQLEKGNSVRRDFWGHNRRIEYIDGTLVFVRSKEFGIKGYKFDFTDEEIKAKNWELFIGNKEA